MSQDGAISSPQLTIDEYCDVLRQEFQDSCNHHFVVIPVIDFQHDDIIDLAVCTKCDAEK